MSLLARLVSAIGLGRASEVKASGVRRLASGRVVQDLSLWAQFQRIGGGLTPLQVSTIIREADAGDMRRLMDLANEARQKDCHLQSVLQTAEQSVAGLDWQIDPPDRPTKKETKAAEFATDCLRLACGGAGIGRLVAHHAGARFFGYAVSETIWRKDGRALVPDHFEHLAPRRFSFEPNRGRFVWRDEGMPVAGVDFLAQYPDKFVVSRPRVTGDVPCREGLVRPLMWAALFRNWSLSDWLKLAEIAWKPWRTGVYKKDASQEDIDNLEAMLDAMTSSGVAVYPETTEIKVEWPGGGASGGGSKNASHADLFDKMGAEMSKVVLGQTLTTEQGRVGSQALGNVQNEVKKDLRDAAGKDVANDITRDLIAPIVRLNFGDRVRPGTMRMLTDDAADIEKLANAVDKLGKAIRIPEVWVQDQAGIPKPAKGDRLVGGAIAGDDMTPDTPAPSGESPEPDDGGAPEPTDGGDTTEGPQQPAKAA